MKPLELANRYMEVLFGNKPIDSLNGLLAESFSFQGPFYAFHSAPDYIAALERDPPEGFSYELLHAYENEHSACLIYQFNKPDISTPMAQTFEVVDGKISKIILIFDTQVFK